MFMTLHSGIAKHRSIDGVGCLTARGSPAPRSDCLFWKRCWLPLTEHPRVTKCPTPNPRRGVRCSRLLGSPDIRV